MRKSMDPFDYVGGAVPRYYSVTNTVIFFDIVGFTKRTSNEEMKRIIQIIEDELATLLWDNYYWNEKKGNNLILVPTGDGYAIGFHPTMPDIEALEVARELFKRITKNKDIKIRMGIAKGPNIRHLDLNEHVNLFGFGIDTAHRISHLARENQILVHEDFAKAILRTQKVDELIDIGEYEIKYRQKIKVFNYFKKDEFGIENLPSS